MVKMNVEIIQMKLPVMSMNVKALTLVLTFVKTNL